MTPAQRLASRMPSALTRPHALDWLPVPIAFVYVAILVVRLPHHLGQVYLNSDVASAPVIASLIGDAPADRIVTLAKNPWYESLWLMQATSWLPAHRQLWELAFLVSSLLAIAIAAWMAHRVLGRSAAVTVAVTGVCASGMLVEAVAPNLHFLAVTHACVLGGSLLLLVERAERTTVPALGAWAVGLTVVTAIGYASDSLVAVAGVLPFAAAAVLTWHRHRGRALARVAGVAVGVSGASLLAGGLLGAYMRDHAHIVGFPLNPTFVAADQIITTTTTYVSSLATIGNGAFFGQSVGLRSVVALAGATLVFVALAAVVMRMRAWLAPQTGEDGAAGATARRGAPPRTVYVTFWSAVVLALTAAYVGTSVALGQGGTERYLIGAFVGAAALLPAIPAVAGRRRAATSLGVALYAAIGVYTLVDMVTAPDNPDTRLWGQIARYVRANGATEGYAPYWDAASLSWASNMRVRAYPVFDCRLPAPTKCPFAAHHISSWYEPAHRRRMFLLVDPRVPTGIAAPDPAFGKPAHAESFGNGVYVEIYNRDLASKIAR